MKRSTKYTPPVFPEDGDLATTGTFAAAQRDGYKRTEDRIIHKRVSVDCDIFGVFDGNLSFTSLYSSHPMDFQ